MRRSATLMFILLMIPAVAAGASRKRGKKDISSYQIEWMTSLDEAKIIALKYCRPIVLHFCPLAPHRIAFNEDASTFDTEEVKVLAPDTVFARIPPETQVELEEKYGIKEIPTIVLIDGKGKRLWKNIEGHCDWPDLVKAIRKAHGKLKPLGRKDGTRLERAWAQYGKAIAKKEYRKAISALKPITNFSRKTWFHSEAKKALEEIDRVAEEILESAKSIMESDPQKASRLLREIEKTFATRPAEKEAAKLYAELKDSEKIRPEEKEMEKETARKLFKEAAKLLDEGKQDSAREKLKELIKKFPDDPFAAEAKRMLSEMGDRK